MTYQLFSKCYTYIYCHVKSSGDSGGGISRDEYISQVARDIQSKLPEVFDLDVIRKKLGLEISPTSVVLLQELERFNKLTLRMIRSLAELQRVSDIKKKIKNRSSLQLIQLFKVH